MDLDGIIHAGDVNLFHYHGRNRTISDLGVRFELPLTTQQKLQLILDKQQKVQLILDKLDAEILEEFARPTMTFWSKKALHRNLVATATLKDDTVITGPITYTERPAPVPVTLDPMCCGGTAVRAECPYHRPGAR